MEKKNVQKWTKADEKRILCQSNTFGRSIIFMQTNQLFKLLVMMFVNFFISRFLFYTVQINVNFSKLIHVKLKHLRWNLVFWNKLAEDRLNFKWYVASRSNIATSKSKIGYIGFLVKPKSTPRLFNRADRPHWYPSFWQGCYRCKGCGSVPIRLRAKVSEHWKPGHCLTLTFEKTLAVYW